MAGLEDGARDSSQSLTLGAVILGVTLSTLHQSGLGALFLMAKAKIHPLWYTEFIPILFFVSSIFAGLSMVILEGTLSHRVFGKQIDAEKHGAFDELLLGLGKGAAIAHVRLLLLQAADLPPRAAVGPAGTRWGAWYLVEVLGFVLVPCVMFAYAVRHRSARPVARRSRRRHSSACCSTA